MESRRVFFKIEKRFYVPLHIDMDIDSYIERIFSLTKGDKAAFEKAALIAFEYQSRENAVYAAYIKALGVSPSQVDSIEKIPFLPISFFKSHDIVCGNISPQEIFLSSGTTGMTPSRHIVKDLSIYTRSYMKGWQYHYGDIEDYTVYALLPSYLERKGSSLITMAEGFISRSHSPHSGFFLYDHENLYNNLVRSMERGEKILLIGVSFALLDFVEKYQLSLPNDAIVMETGGMKGRRREMIREELHEILCKGFGTDVIHSEYGMTEMLSQAYSSGGGIYTPVPWMGVRLRDAYDPLSILDVEEKHRGAINIIDLANVHSCSFIATEDIGILHRDGTFEVLGRMSSSEIRGCNLMVADVL